MKANQLPEVTRTYQNHTLDSTRWQHYTPREGDVVVSTSHKSGTTWMQLIVLNLIYLGQEVPTLMDVSPWIDSRFLMPVEGLKQMLAADENRRCIKTHLPLDSLPYFPQLKYIVVGRDARDVFMSWWNHYSNYTDYKYTLLNSLPGRVGDPLPRCPEDIRECWHNWITRGWFEWESEGYPHSGNMYHTQTWWNFRHLENILFVHFNDLLANVEEEIERIADFLHIPVSEESISTIAHAVNIQTVKKNPATVGDPKLAAKLWKGGADTFIYKGTNGRWKGVLTADVLELYEKAKARLVITHK
jgi:aryl sulfotransferase